MQKLRDLSGKIRRYCVSDLHILLCTISKEQVVVRKSLQSRSFADSQAAALNSIWMNEIVSVFRDMAGHSRGRLVSDLYPETVVEYARMPIAMIGTEFYRKINGFRAVSMQAAKSRGKHISAQITRHMPSGLVLSDSFQLCVLKPLNQQIVGGAISARERR